MIPDRLQFFLNDFWNFEKLVKICARGPPNYYQNAFNNARNMGTSWKHIIFVNLGLNKF